MIRHRIVQSRIKDQNNVQLLNLANLNVVLDWCAINIKNGDVWKQKIRIVLDRGPFQDNAALNTRKPHLNVALDLSVKIINVQFHQRGVLQKTKGLLNAVLKVGKLNVALDWFVTNTKILDVLKRKIKIAQDQILFL